MVVGANLAKEPAAIVPIGGVLVVAFVWWAFVLLRKRQLIADTPASRCAGVFMGWNEVEGRAFIANPSVSRLTRTPSVWWSFTVEDEVRVTRTETSTDSEGRATTRDVTTTEWRVIDHGSDQNSFFVVDETGHVMVDPQHATVKPRSVLDEIVGGGGFSLFAGDGPTGRIRHREQVIAVDDPIYVTGVARVREGEAVPVIDAAGDGPFVVTTGGKKSVARGYTWGGPLLLVVALGIGAAASNMAWNASGRAHSPIGFVTGVGVGALIIAVASLTLVFNGLVRVRNRCDRAYSLIDVMLQRRHDLIPQIAACVKAATAHESDVLVDVAELRDGAIRAEEASKQAEAQGAALTTLMGRAEAYPLLTTDASFVQIQHSLSDTEDRIAAARDFYNESVTTMRTRTGSFPGVLVAKFGEFTMRPLFAAEGFERTVPHVDLM